MTMYTTMDSPLGELFLVGEESATAKGGTTLASLSMPSQNNGATRQEGWIEKPEAFVEIIAQLRAYFDGALTRFDIEYVSKGSEFQQRVWRVLEDVPFGSTVSYGDIAAHIGAPASAARAVGAAVGANPLLVVRPCHRVIGADGALTGYAAGSARKQQLLDLERAYVAA